jgi:hypothetical protein
MQYNALVGVVFFLMVFMLAIQLQLSNLSKKIEEKEEYISKKIEELLKKKINEALRNK